MTDQRRQTEAVDEAAAVAWRLARFLRGDRRVRYVLVGGVGAVTYYAIFSVGWLLLSPRVSYLVLAIIANFLTAVLTYPLYRYVVFLPTGSWAVGFLRFYVTALWALAYALLGLPLLVEFVHLHVLVALPIIIVTAPLINYQIHRLWAFRQRRAPQHRRRARETSRN